MSTEGYVGSTDWEDTLSACEQGSGVGDSAVFEELEPVGTLLLTAGKKTKCYLLHGEFFSQRTDYVLLITQSWTAKKIEKSHPHYRNSLGQFSLYNSAF